MSNEVMECENCEAVITEGYLAEWSGDCFCSKECAESCIGAEDVAEGLEDETFFWTVWTEWDSITNTTQFPQIHKCYLLHGNIYFSRETASLFEDGKDYPSVIYILVKPDDTYFEGGQMENYDYGFSKQEVRESYLED